MNAGGGLRKLSPVAARNASDNKERDDETKNRRDEDGKVKEVEMSKPRLVKREEVERQMVTAPSAPAKPSITKQLKQAILERQQAQSVANPRAARAAFAALFATA